jgi:hypothetical protein
MKMILPYQKEQEKIRGFSNLKFPISIYINDCFSAVMIDIDYLLEAKLVDYNSLEICFSSYKDTLNQTIISLLKDKLMISITDSRYRFFKESLRDKIIEYSDNTFYEYIHRSIKEYGENGVIEIVSITNHIE